MGVAGRQRVKEIFPIDRMVERYQQLYDQLVRAKGRRTRRAEA
jgi:hypothetical protein